MSKSTMFQVGNYFVRISDSRQSLKLAVWDDTGDKLLSEFVSNDHSGRFWNMVGNRTSDTVVEAVKERIYA